MNFDGLPDLQFIFGSLFLITNRIDTLLKKELTLFDVTAKQWFLSIMIYSLFDSPPTINDVAKMMGSTHQNIKQIALKLAQKNLLFLEKDKNDKRVTRLVSTKYSAEFWTKTDQAAANFISKLFADFTDEDLTVARKILGRLWENLDKIGDS